MKILLRYSFIILLLGVIFITASPSIVSACSYGGAPPSTLKELITHSDYVVQARVAEVDDASQNAVLQIESYLAGGSGPAYLLLMRNDPIYTKYLLAGRSSGGDCLGLYQSIYPGQPLYIFLARKDNGSYTAIDETAYIFPTSDATTEIYLQENMEYGKGQKVTEQEFVKLIAQEGEQIPSQPAHNMLYPLKAPLRLTTASGSHYILPIDGHSPFKITPEFLKAQEDRYPLQGYGFSDAGHCNTQDCKSVSPDGLNIAVQTDENTITLTQGKQIAGQASLFSSTSDTIAVWNHCQLSIYTTGYPRLLEKWYSVREFQHIELHGDNNCAAFSKLARWGSNGRLLAYSDEKGLWLWDTFSLLTQPRLLIPTSTQGIPLAHQFSPLDGYLSVIEGSERYIVDLSSKNKIPDGLISSDERLLLKFDTSASVFDLEVCAIVPYNCQTVRHMYISVYDASGVLVRLYDDLSQVHKVEWTGSNTFSVLTCVPEDETLCAVFVWRPSFQEWDSSLISEGQAFDYDPSNDALAILKDGKTIIVANQTYDLSGIKDGEIVNIEWLPSLFYRNK